MIWCVSNAISIVSLPPFIAVWPVNITFPHPGMLLHTHLPQIPLSLPSEFPIFSSYYLPSSKSFTFLPVYLHLAICYYHNQQFIFCQCLTMQLFSHFCIFMTPMSKGMFPYTLAYRHVNDLRPWGGVQDAPDSIFIPPDFLNLFHCAPFFYLLWYSYRQQLRTALPPYITYIFYLLFLSFMSRWHVLHIFLSIRTIF